MHLSDKSKYAIITFFIVEAFIGRLEQISGVPLDEVDLIKFVLISITDVLNYFMPTTGPFAQSASMAIFFKDFVVFMIRLLPGLFAARFVWGLMKDPK